MCNCNSDVTMGGYENQVVLDIPDTLTIRMNDDVGTPRKNVCIDACLVNEIKELWSKGIITTGCCCGHNIREAFIGVVDEDIQRMKDLGYTVQYNPSRPEDEDTFNSRSIK